MLIVLATIAVSILGVSSCKSSPFDAKQLRPSAASILTRFGIGVLEVYPLLSFDVDIEILVLVLTLPSISDEMYVRRASVERALQLFDS
jgi:hypothetical protein